MTGDDQQCTSAEVVSRDAVISATKCRAQQPAAGRLGSNISLDSVVVHRFFILYVRRQMMLGSLIMFFCNFSSYNERTHCKVQYSTIYSDPLHFRRSSPTGITTMPMHLFSRTLKFSTRCGM